MSELYNMDKFLWVINILLDLLDTDYLESFSILKKDFSLVLTEWTDIF